MSKNCKNKTENYNKLADKIYDLICEEDPSWGDAVASLELVRLWIFTDYQDMHNENKNSKTEIIEVEE
jgi:hypothetical protein